MTEMLDFVKEIVQSVSIHRRVGGTIDLEAGATENSKRKRGKTKKNSVAPAAGEQEKRCKRKVDADADGAGPKSEPKGDTTMDEDDDRGGCAESSHRDQDADCQEDSPYVPRW